MIRAKMVTIVTINPLVSVAVPMVKPVAVSAAIFTPCSIVLLLGIGGFDLIAAKFHLHQKGYPARCVGVDLEGETMK